MSRGKDYSRRKGRDKGPSFLQIFHYVYDSAAYRDLDPVARALYAALRRRFNGTNNGTIGLGCREAAEEINVTARTASRAFDDLIDHGFIRVTTNSTFHQKRMAREWLLTELRDDRGNGVLPTKDFASWVPSPCIVADRAPPGLPKNVVALRDGKAAA
jgi:hypothetical protein